MGERVKTVLGNKASRPISDFMLGIAGTEYYVGPNATGAGDDGRSGRSKETSLATLTAALALATASKGDIIYLLPGHAETVTAAIDINKIGVRIVGLGTGKLRPAFTCNAAIDCMTVTVADVLIENVYFPASTLTGVTARINVAAANCTIKSCLFLCGVYDLETITVADAGDDLLVENCEWRVTADGPDAGIEVEANGVDGLQIKNCHFNGGSDTNGWDVGGINSGVTHTNCLIKDNTFLFGPAIIFSSTAKGLIQGNAMGEGTLGSMLDPGSCMCVGNYETDAVDESGSLFPQATPVGGGIATDVAAILTDTAVIGALGVGLTDLGGMSTGMKAEIESECTDALAADNLDHLLELDGTEAYPEQIATDSIVAKMLCKGAAATANTYNNTTDSQEAISDELAEVPKETGAKTFNSTALQSIQDECEDALEGEDLDHLLKLDDAGQNYPVNCANDSVIAKMIAKGATATASTYDNVTDSQEMISDKLGGFSGDGGAVSDDSVKASLDLLQTHADATPQCVEKSDGAVLNGLDPIFTISGGPVRAKIVGLVTGAAIGGAATGRLQHITTEPAATVELSAGAVAIDTDPAGTFYYSKGATSVFTPSGGLGFALIDPVTIEETEFLLAPGVVQFLASAAQTGVIAWYMSYIPLSPDSVVTAAA